MKEHIFSFQMYTIVEFSDASVEYVPDEWLFGRDEVYWPVKLTQVENLRRKKDEPDATRYKLYTIRVLGGAGTTCI